MQKREGRSFAAPPTIPVRPDLGRTGRRGLPPQAPLPPLTSALSRRAALFGAVSVAGVTAAAAVPAAVQAAPMSANDRRLVELADAYELLDRRCNEHTAAHRHLSGAAARACDLVRAVQDQIRRTRDRLLTFPLLLGEVEAMNNACECDLRPTVIQRKVTNGYRSA